MAELDISGILAALTGDGVDFLVIGGVAVGFHGYIRATKDVDVEGADEFEDGELPDPHDPDALALGGNWVLRTRLGRFDVMQWLGEEALWARLAPGAVAAQVDGLVIKMRKARSEGPR